MSGCHEEISNVRDCQGEVSFTYPGNVALAGCLTEDLFEEELLGPFDCLATCTFATSRGVCALLGKASIFPESGRQDSSCNAVWRHGLRNGQ